MTAFIGALLLSVVISYLLGSVNFAVVVSRAMAHFDVRERGSGNAGMTNVVRTVGWKAGAITFLGDTVKGVAAVLLTRYLLLEPAFAKAGENVSPFLQPKYLIYFCAIACMLGHVFPLFFQFRGGKGVATAIGVLFCIHWQGALMVLAVFLILLLMTRTVSIGSVMGAVEWILSVILLSAGNSVALRLYETALAVVLGGIVILKHKDNIRRLYRGEEKTIW